MAVTTATVAIVATFSTEESRMGSFYGTDAAANAAINQAIVFDWQPIAQDWRLSSPVRFSALC